MKSSLTGIIFLLLLIFGCQNNRHKPREKKTIVTEKKVNLVLVPLGNISNSLVNQVFNSLYKISPNTRVLGGEDLPKLAYYPARNRYRADSIIAWLGRRANQNEVYIGITTNDISTTNKERGVDDWGVMGLGFCPGPAYVISNYRLKDKSPNNLFKIVVHEVGHTSGLSHCPLRTCFMSDAEGGPHFRGNRVLYKMFYLS